MRNTIVNRTQGGNCGGTILSLGNNVETGDSCSLNGPSDRKNVDARLGPLQNNGGPTDTQALLPDSPAIDGAASATCPATDQRGVPRPIDGNGDGVAGCDIGAYEYLASDGPLPPALCSPRPPVRVGSRSGGGGRLAVTIEGTDQQNTLRTLRFTRLTNAEVDVADQIGRGSPFSLDLASGVSRVDVQARRLVGGRPWTVQVIVVDRCGEWPTFFGGGPNAS
jgi:hypothetical protein